MNADSAEAQIGGLSWEELESVLGRDHFPRARALVMPLANAQRELLMLLDQRDAVVADKRTTEAQRAQALSDLDAAIQHIVGSVSAFSASLSSAKTASALFSASPSKVSAATVKEFLARTDRWSGPYLPLSLKDWATALGLGAGSSKPAILERLRQLSQENLALEKDAFLNDAVRGLSVARVRLSAARRRIANGVKDAQELLALHVFAASMSWLSAGTTAPPTPAGGKTYGIAPGLIVTLDAQRFRARL